MHSSCCTLSLPAISQPPVGSVMAIAYRAPSVVRAWVVKAIGIKKAPAPNGRNPNGGYEGDEGNACHGNNDALQAAVQRVYDHGDGEVSRARLPYKAIEAMEAIEAMRALPHSKSNV